MGSLVDSSNSESTSDLITDKIELVEPTKEHYVFIGWTGTDLAEPTKNLVIENKTGNRTYVANYSPKEYSITYEGLLRVKSSYIIELKIQKSIKNHKEKIDKEEHQL